MKRRHSSRDAITIGDEMSYTEALMVCLDAHEEFGKFDGATVEEEKSTPYRMSEAAANNSWAALTAVIDTYVARRISETLERL